MRYELEVYESVRKFVPLILNVDISEDVSSVIMYVTM